MSKKPTLCIGILTLNEERRIAQCIASAQFADHIVVVDSGSKDDTVAIAQNLGAQVHIHPDWQGFAEQRNRLIQLCNTDYIYSPSAARYKLLYAGYDWNNDNPSRQHCPDTRERNSWKRSDCEWQRHSDKRQCD